MKPRSFEPCLSILPEPQRRLWPHLRPAAGLGFALYGGTAIALRLGHRASVDFDFFNAQPLDRDALRAAVPLLERAVVLQERSNTLTWLVADDVGATVKVSFFGTIGFGRFGRPELTVDGVLQVASQDDLLATKLKVLLQRVEAKDYLDIAALLRAGVRLERGLAIARAMFGTAVPAERVPEGDDLVRGRRPGDTRRFGARGTCRSRLFGARLPSVKRQSIQLAM